MSVPDPTELPSAQGHSKGEIADEAAFVTEQPDAGSSVHSANMADLATASSSSDSEAEENDDTRTPRLSARRKADSAVFAAWVQRQAKSITQNEVQAALENGPEENMSIRSLTAKQESQVIITDPREYQVELFEKAKQQNIIAVLDTGSGKTLIAVLLLKHIIDQELEDRAIGRKRRISFFLVDCVTLVFQQFAVLECNLDQNIAHFCGDMGCDLWSKATWRNHFDENMVIVCTAEILYQCLFHSFLSLDEINLLVFDEAHHTKKNHAYARIIKEFYIPQSDLAKRPKIFGMTASPVDARVDVKKAAKDLEAMLDCQIATTSDLSLLRMSVSRPKEQILVYDHLSPAYDTPLCSKLRSIYPDVEVFSKIFKFAHDATSQLGDWCADQVWRFALTDVESRKVERKTEQKFLRDQENRPMDVLNNELNRLREAKNLIEEWPFPPLRLETNSLSPKVLLLHRYLEHIYGRPTDTKCIIFAKRCKTARLLTQLLTQIGGLYFRCDLLIGSGSGDYGDVKFSFRQQILTLMRFKSGELNCLIATSVAEEGLDIPDCNLVIRFDLYDTLIQYIQSRGRARHANSKYLHMVEDGNIMHYQAIDEVRQGEKVMRQFCEALPADRLLEGNDRNLEVHLAKEKGQRIFEDPATGAKLTYANSLVILAHFVGCLPHSGKVAEQAAYVVSVENRQYVCEVILPEISPLHSAIGRPCSRKTVAKRSAAFEACCLLRQKEYLDSNLIPIYHKYLPQMRNAHLALNSNKSNAYVMKIKPNLWKQTRGTRPERLYAMVIELEYPDRLGRPCQPLGFLTRTPMPRFPPFLLHLQFHKASDVLCTPLAPAFDIDSAELGELTEFTLRIYKDTFNKTFEFDEAGMTYWLAPINPEWRHLLSTLQSPKMLLEWSVITLVFQNIEFSWSVDTPPQNLINRYLIDRWDGGRRFFSLAVEPGLKPHDKVPEDVAKHKHMGDILDYSVSLFARSRAKATWLEDQPVIRAEKILHRLNWLNNFSAKEAAVKTKAYVCPQPLKFSALPIAIVSMGYLFPTIIYRIESYLIALEACDMLGLSVKPELALEAITKDSGNTEDYRGEQLHVQRGMGKNYERLEFIGDCFLKMATSITLFSTAPDNDEYEYHVRRMVMICNKNLLSTALKCELYEYVRSQSFSRRTWYPQGIKLLEGKGHKKTGSEILKHQLGDKTVADVCEAIIGAALLSHDDMDMAVRAVTALVSSDDHNVTKWSDYYPMYTKPKYQVAEATASQLDLAMQVEKVHSYHFQYPRLLRSAFIHPSYTFLAEKIPCYQRLEFLGDSLLDIASVNFLYHRHPDKDPQWLTEHKMAMVSNKFLAALSVRLGFHKHLRSSGTNIEYQNREYVIEVQEAEKMAKGARDYWTNTKQPPKALSDIVESYIGAIFVDSEYKFHEVERFFDAHVRWYFEDMSVYDTFANSHPTTYLHNLMKLSLGCNNYRLMASEVPSVAPGGPVTSIAALIVHGKVVADGQASSGKDAKVKASSNALKLLRGLAPFVFRQQYHCNCDRKKKDSAGKNGHRLRTVGSAI